VLWASRKERKIRGVWKGMAVIVVAIVLTAMWKRKREVGIG
jgi:phage shock protein PspC (stress-responsive transcriptional regulator)